MNPMSPTALLNDLYQFTMAQGYVDAGVADQTAVFDAFYRRAPFGGSFAIAAGVEEAIDFVANFRFSGQDIEYLSTLGLFTDDLLDRLAKLRFSGDVSAVPEGTIIFPRQNFLRVTAPLLEAQLLETPLLNTLGFSTLCTTKAARIHMAADGADVFEFGCRRAQRADAAVTASRCAYLAGCSGTSNLEAARRWGIPARGTMAHSWVLTFGDEHRAFRAYAQRFRDTSVFLIDTYDTLNSGLPAAIDVALEMRQRGQHLLGVRLDSGDPLALSIETRARLDAAGLDDVRIVASGDLDEHRIAALVERKAPIDIFGVGTSVAVCKDEPSLSIVYKLAALAGDDTDTLEPRCKSSDEPGKATLPGVKEIYRFRTTDGIDLSDRIALAGETPENWARPDNASLPGNWTPLLDTQIERGQRRHPPEDLDSSRDRVREGMARLQKSITRLENAATYPVNVSPKLERLDSTTRARR